jgi:tripartite-type tricarboxylate transporter receptor subunit TctC
MVATNAALAPAPRIVPTIGESVPGFEISTWQGIGAPKNTPAEIVAALNKEINAGLADPKVKARILELGGEPAPISTADFESESSMKRRAGPR